MKRPSVIKVSRMLIYLLVLLSLLISGCSTPTTPPPPTVTPVPTDTETPVPTNTATQTPEPTSTATSTPEPTATATATPNRTGTAQAIQTATSEAFFAQVQPDLDSYGLELKDGHLVWMSSAPVAIDVTGYLEHTPRSLDKVGSIADFFWQTDIKWKTTTGLSGCGLIFRSEEDFKKGEQYRFVMMRLQYHPLWELEYLKDGYFQYAVTVDGNAQSTGNLKDDNNSTNTVAIMAVGEEITTFINGRRLNTVKDSKRASGLLAFLGWQESGETSCEFSNSWVWGFDK